MKPLFKVGDRVKVVRNTLGKDTSLIGVVGTIIGINGFDKNGSLVGQDLKYTDGFTNYTGKESVRFEYWLSFGVEEGEIELI